MDTQKEDKETRFFYFCGKVAVGQATDIHKNVCYIPRWAILSTQAQEIYFDKSNEENEYKVLTPINNFVEDSELKKLWYHSTTKSSKRNTRPLFEAELKKRGYELFENLWLKNDQVRTIKHLRKLSSPEGLIHYGQKSFTIDQFINQVKSNTSIGKEYVKGLVKAEEFLNS